MASLLTEYARAYVNHGRWIADCPRPYCGNAEALQPGAEQAFVCTNCHLLARIEWPPDAEAIWAALEVRPVPQTRNWFPADHELAVRAGCPHGQTVADLEAETREFTHEGER
jgi:hypothetical protein